MCQGEFLNKNEENADAYFEWLVEQTPDWQRMGVVAEIYSRRKALTN